MRKVLTRFATERLTCHVGVILDLRAAFIVGRRLLKRNIIRGHMSGPEEIRLVGPGGAGKSTIGARLAERLEVAFVDLDRYLAGRVGDISEYIGRQGYNVYARENVEAYCSLFRGEIRPGVVALSSDFMTYPHDIHPEYSRVRQEIEQHPHVRPAAIL